MNSIARVLTLVLLFCSGQSAFSADSGEYLRQAQQYLASGEVKSAVIQLKNALQEDPSNTEARLMLGRIYIRLGDGASAQKEIERAIDLKAPRESWQVELGQAYLLQRKFDEILNDIEPDPTLPGEVQAAVMVLRGQAYMANRQLNQARSAYQQALTSSPNDQAAEFGLVRLMLASGEIEQGREMLDRFLDAHPDHQQALILRGELQRRNRQNEQALADFDRVVAGDPNNLQALLGRVAIHLQQANYDLASKDLTTLDQTAPDSPLVIYLHAVSAFQQRDFTAAEEYIQKVLELLPNHAQSQLIYGAILFAKGNLATADEYLSRANASIPNHLPTIKLLAAARVKQRQPKRAIEVLEPAVERYPEDAQLLAMLGNAYLQTNRFQEGSELLGRAVEIAPELATLRTQLAFGLLAQGDTSKAIDELQTAVDLGQELIQADILLVLSHLRNQEIEQALQASKALEKRDPDNPIAHNLTGLAYLASGDETNARESFARALELDPKFVTAQLNLARIELSRNRLDQAEIEFKGVLAQAPGNLAAQIGLAGLEERRNNRAGMYQWLTKAQESNPGSSRPGIMLAQAYLQDGDHFKALRIARETVSSFPDQPGVLQVLGRAQLAAGESNSAIQSLQQLAALQRTPQNLVLLAAAQRSVQDMSGAEQSLRAALEIDSNNLPALSSLGVLLLQQGDYQQAQEIAGRLQEAYPQKGVGYELAGSALLNQNNAAQALVAYQQAYQVEPSANLALQLTRMYAAQGETEQSLNQLKEWLQKNPGDVAVGTTYGVLLQQQGLDDEALAQYQRVLEIAPENVMALNNLAWIYQQRGDQRALSLGERAYRLAPQRPEIADTYGWILVNFGSLEQGLGILQEAFSKSPDNPEIGYHVGFALVKVGRTAEASKLLQRIVRDHADSPFAQQARELNGRL